MKEYKKLVNKIIINNGKKDIINIKHFACEVIKRKGKFTMNYKPKKEQILKIKEKNKKGNKD